MIKDASITGIYGARGTGKSTRAKNLTKDIQRLIVFDVMQEYQHENCKVFNGVIFNEMAVDILQYVRQHYKTGYRIAIQPMDDVADISNLFDEKVKVLDCTLELNKLVRLIFKIQQPYKDGNSTDKVTLLIEEMSISVPNNNSTMVKGIVNACNIGRHFGIDIIGVSQRPAQVHTDFQGQCENNIYFRLGSEADYKKVGAVIGTQQVQKLKNLPQHHYICYDGEQLTQGVNILK